MPTFDVEGSDSLDFREDAIGEQFRAVADALGLSAVGAYDWAVGVRDGIGFAAAGAATATLLAMVSQNLRFNEAVALAWTMAVEDSLELSDSVEVARIKLAVAVDSLRLADSSLTQLEALVAVVAGFGLAASAGPAFDVEAVDQVEFTASAATVAELVAALSDTLTFSDTAAGAMRLTVAVEDTFGLDDAAVTQLTAFQAVTDGFRIAVSIRIGEEDYFAYVLHTDPVDKQGTRPVSEYRNYPFNSFAAQPSRRRQLAAGAGGIYALEGDDDAGAAIEGWFRTGLQLLNGAGRKRLPEMFLAARARDNAMFVKVIHVDVSTGEKVETWYDLIPGPVSGDNFRKNQIRLNQGVQAVWWQTELRNKDGADFDVSELTFYPVLLDRS